MRVVRSARSGRHKPCLHCWGTRWAPLLVNSLAPVRMRPSVRSILRVSPSRSNPRTPPAATSGVNREIQGPRTSSGASPSVRTGTASPDSLSECPSASSRRSPGPPRGPQPPTTSIAPSPTSPRLTLQTASSSEPKTRHSPAGSVTPLRTRQTASAPDALALTKTRRACSPGKEALAAGSLSGCQRRWGRREVCRSGKRGGRIPRAPVTIQGRLRGSRQREPASSGRIRRHRPHVRSPRGGRELRVLRPPRRRPEARWRERNYRPAREGVVHHFR